MIGRINSVIKLRESAQTLTAVEHDELTGVYTRQAFFYHAKSFLKTRPGERFHLVIADIRDFKLINSSYGEKVGDEILCYLAGIYTKMLKTGLVSRYGSDQFVCMTCDDCDLSLETVTKIEKEIAEHAPVPNLMVKYGVYQDIDKSLPVSVICDRGFMAIRSIRDNYECNIAYYTEKMKQKQMQDRLLENRFESAIKNKEFVAYFQPKYDVKTERITGAESLVRWINQDGSMVMPGDFIPLYEKDGLIVKLDEYIFRYVCEFQRELMEKGQELIPISVNLSRTSIHHSDLVERYMKIVEENGIPFSSVPVELTETATLNSVLEAYKAVLEQGKNARGVTFETKEEQKVAHDLFLLTTKPVLYVANVDEASAKTGNEYSKKVEEIAKEEGAECMVIAAKTEEDIASLETYEDKLMFLEELGLEESGVNRLIKKAYALLNLETFITAGEMEVKAWTYHKGWKAPQCAGVIHTDFEKGFIRAEVIKYDDYIKYGSEAAVREAGKLGIEGKEYVVQDGDIMHFRFNV